MLRTLIVKSVVFSVSQTKYMNEIAKHPFSLSIMHASSNDLKQISSTQSQHNHTELALKMSFNDFKLLMSSFLGKYYYFLKFSNTNASDFILYYFFIIVIIHIHGNCRVQWVAKYQKTTSKISVDFFLSPDSCNCKCNDSEKHLFFF